MKFKLILFVLIIASISIEAQAQKYFTRSGKVSFHSKAMLEDIDAYNKQATFVLNNDSKQIQMAILIKSFQFKKALMQEHFNENYMESDEFPKAVFKGKIVSPSSIDLSQKGDFPICKIAGDITIRGITKKIECNAKISIDEEGISASTTFPLAVADFNIKIPSMVKDKIAKELEVRLDLKLEKM